ICWWYQRAKSTHKPPAAVSSNPSRYRRLLSVFAAREFGHLGCNGDFPWNLPTTLIRLTLTVRHRLVVGIGSPRDIGWDGRIRTCDGHLNRVLPCRLATSQYLSLARAWAWLGPDLLPALHWPRDLI